MDESDYVSIATIHSVKGLEFPCVFICGLEDGIMPSSRAESEGEGLEEERRLMYVAITRAKRRLYLTRSKSRYLYGHRDLTKPSKFISELSSELGVKASAGYSRPSLSKSYYSPEDGYESDIAPEYSGFAPKSNYSFKPISTPPKKNSNAGSYAVGMRVRHAKFGTGMIVAVKNGGTVVNVAFEGQGIKELSASIAPLEII